MTSRFGTVLVVDDDERLLAAFERYLANGRARLVLTAKTATQALNLARKYDPPLVIVDLQLGKESGIELVRRLKCQHPSITAVLITGYASVESTVEAMRAGADDVVTKPVTWSEILMRLVRKNMTGTEAPLRVETPTLARAQWEHVQRVLADCDHNISMAARRLGMYRGTLQRWLRRHGPRT